jgi:beta-glucosidase
MKKIILVNALLLSISFSMLGQKKWSETPKGNFSVIENKGGLTIGYSPKSGVTILTIDGFAFKEWQD